MQAVILAAGKGARIYPLSMNKPKPLIEVANKPVLEHNLDQMLGLIEEAIIIVGYKRDQIIQRFGDNYKGMRLKYVVQEEQLGTGHAVLMAEPYLKGKFLVINGDDLYSRKDMENITRYDCCILVKHKEEASAFGAVIVENGLVKDLVEKPKRFISNLVNVGMYCFCPMVFDYLHRLEPSVRGEYELTDVVKVLAGKKMVHYEEVQGFWIPVGYPWHILEATQQLLEEEEEISIKGQLAEGVVIEGSVDLGEGSKVGKGTLLRGSIVIGKNSVIEEDCIIEGFTAISDDCLIKRGTKLSNVIMGKKSQLEEQCIVKDSVLGESVCLSKGVTVSNLGKKSTVLVNSNGKSYDSKRENLGAFIGDRCTVSRRLGPGECVDKDC